MIFLNLAFWELPGCFPRRLFRRVSSSSVTTCPPNWVFVRFPNIVQVGFCVIISWSQPPGCWESMWVKASPCQQKRGAGVCTDGVHTGFAMLGSALLWSILWLFSKFEITEENVFPFFSFSFSFSRLWFYLKTMQQIMALSVICFWTEAASFSFCALKNRKLSGNTFWEKNFGVKLD